MDKMKKYLWTWRRSLNVIFLRCILFSVEELLGYFPDDVKTELFLAARFVHNAINTQGKYNTYEKFQEAKTKNYYELRKGRIQEWMRGF